jgi:hypothetical protein
MRGGGGHVAGAYERGEEEYDMLDERRRRACCGSS